MNRGGRFGPFSAFRVGVVSAYSVVQPIEAATMEAGVESFAAPSRPNAEQTTPPAPADANANRPDAQADGDANRPDAEQTTPPDPGGTDSAAPIAGEPRAMGGVGISPLPPAPPAVDPAGLVSDPWRGRFWFSLGLHASIPVGGRPPAAGVVVAPAAEVTLGWRIRPFVSLLSSVSNFAHDAGTRSVTDIDGEAIDEVIFGRITAFDLLVARFYWPRARRWDPWLDVGAGIGTRKPPVEPDRDVVGIVRAGAGVDLWLAPRLTLGPSVAYRLVILGTTVGHTLRVGSGLGIHW